MNETILSGGRVRHPVRVRAIALGKDTLVASSILRTLHAEATDTFSQEYEGERLIVRFGSRTDAPSAADRLGTAYKMLFIFVRAYQDAIYGVLWEQITGHRVGKDSSMRNAAEKPGNPVGAVLRERVLGYVEWFTGTRDLRNEVKSGANFGLVGPVSDLGVSVNAVDDRGGLRVEFRQGRVLKLYDATVAIGATKLVTELARDVIPGAQEPENAS
jgi:hypothetical protein